MGAESEGSGGFKVDRVLVEHLFSAFLYIMGFTYIALMAHKI